MVSELFPLACLFSKEILDLLSVKMEVRNFLHLHGANITQYSSRNIIKKLAYGLCP